MSRPLDALDEVQAGTCLRETADAIVNEMMNDGADLLLWDGVIGTDRDVFNRFATELRARGFEIVRSR